MAIGNTDLGITLGARVDTSQAQKDIDAFTREDKSGNKRRKVVLDADIKLEKASEQFDKLINKTRRLDDTFKKISTSFALNLKGTFNGEDVEGLTKVTEKFKSDLGEIKERVTIFNEDGKYLTSSLQTIKSGIQEVSNTTTIAIEEVDNVTTKVTTLEKVIEDTDGIQHKIITTTKEWIDEQNRLHQEIKVTDENEKQLSATQKNVINDTKKVTKLMNEFADALARTQEPQTKKTKTSTFIDKDGNKIITEYVDNVATLRTEIKTYTDEVGNLITQTDVYNAKTSQLISTHQELTRDIHQSVEEDKKREQELANVIEKINQERLAQERLKKAITTTTTTHSKGKIQQFGNTIDTREYDALITKTIQVNEANEKVIKTTYEFTNAQGQLVRQTRTTDGYLNKIAEDTVEVSDGFNRTGESAEKANYGVKNLGWNLSDAISRLSNFYIASLPIRAVQTAITETIATVKDFDSALIEFRKVSDLAGESLTNYVAKLAEMGEITGSTMQAMVEASTEFRKSGFTDEDSAKLASIAEMYRNIADEEISAADSASFIIAQMKAFNIEADQAEHIIDAVNEVANNFSVSSADLAQNLGNMSAIMAINNVSMEEQIGMLTGVTEITRNASSASRGLVMVSSRLTQVLDNTSSTGKKLTAIYNDLGIELKDENGQLRSHYDILSDLAGQWDSLSENQQKYIALTSAGARQQQNFVSLMENWGQVAKATATAYNSLGSAERENEKVMDSVAKKVEILKSQFQQLVIGKGGLQDFAKTLLNIGIALLKFANSDIGKTLIQITAFETAIILVSKGLKTLKADIIAHAVALVTDTMATKGRTAAEIEAKVAEIGLTKAIQYSTAALIDNAIAFASTPFGAVTLLLGAVAAITIANARAMETYNKRLETAKENLDELSDSAKTAKDELDGLKGSLKSIQDQIKSNNENKLKIQDKDALEVLDKENEKLKQQEETLKRQITLQERKLELAQQEAEEQALTTLNTTTSSQFKKTEMVDSFSGAGTGEFVGVEVTPEKELQLAIDRYKELKEEARQLQQQLDATDSNSEEWVELNSKLEATSSEMDKVEGRGLEMAEIITDAADNLTSTNGKVVEYKEALYNLVDSLYETTGAEKEVVDQQEKTVEEYEKEAEEAEELEKHLETLSQTLGITATELEGLRERFDDLTLDNFLSQLAEIKKEISDTNTVIDNLQEALESASTALEEYNENGYLTLDTFQGLMNISAQYLAALVNEEGQLEINQTTLGNLVEQLKVAKIEELQHAAAMEIAANHTDDAKTASANAEGAVSSIGKTIENTGNKALTAAGHVATFAASVASLSGVSQKDWTAKDRETVNRYKDLASQIAKIEINTTRAGNAASSAGKKGAGAAKQAKDATKELNKELEETKKKYETVIKWISKQYDKEIDKIKKAEKETLKAEEAKIKAKEKEKDNALDAIEKEIDALKKEKDARKKYWDDQIDALKKQNDAAKDALELQEKLDALEKARNTRVKIYKEGQGFVYDVDQTAVAKVQKELDEYLSQKAYEDELERLEALRDAEMDNYEQRLDALNDYKDKVQEAYEAEIEALNEHKEKLQEQYEAEIEIYENYKQQFEDMVNAYEEEQNRLLAQQLTGIDFENKNWMTRLDNLAAFVNEYNKLQKQLDTGNTSVSNTASMKSGGSNVGGVSKTTATTGSYDREMALSHQGYHGMPTNVITGTRATSGLNQYIPTTEKTNVSSNGVIKKHAKGIGSVKQDELAIVGENPNKEIVIGSKINNGELMNLGKGTGVVNADSSKTLAGMLNQVGQFGASGFGSGNGTLNNNINNDSLTINGVTIQGANINDPETFVNGLLNMKAEAIQRAYRHR